MNWARGRASELTVIQNFPAYIKQNEARIVHGRVFSCLGGGASKLFGARSMP